MPVANLYQALQFLHWNRPSILLQIREQAWATNPAGIANEKPMAVYMIADIKVTDNKWVPAYAASVHELVHKHGGKYLSRSGNIETLEGNPLDTNLIALIQFPSTQAVKSFLADPKYAPFAAARKDGSESRFQLIDDTDLAGTIPYLPKGQ
ncbi:MAG: DUF1330 domain-containing protein [Pseudolabrys sp.]